MYIFYCRLHIFTLRLNRLYIFGQPYAYPNKTVCLCYWQWYVDLVYHFHPVYRIPVYWCFKTFFVKRPILHISQFIVDHSRFSVPSRCTQYFSYSRHIISRYIAQIFSVFSIELLLLCAMPLSWTGFIACWICVIYNESKYV